MHNKFFKSVKKMLVSMKKFWPQIIIASILATTASILTIAAPNKLSSLTDELTKGLIPNKSNLELIVGNIKNNLNEETLKNINSKLIVIDNNKVRMLIAGGKIPKTDIDILLKKDPTLFNKLSHDTKVKILKDVTIDNKIITNEDIVTYL